RIKSYLFEEVMATSNIDQQDPMATVNESILEEETDESAMSLVEHLEELRWRVLKTFIAIAIGSVIAFIFREPILSFLTYALPKNADMPTHGRLITTGVAEGFTVFLKLSLAVGFLIALPVILYQVWAFIS